MMRAAWSVFALATALAVASPAAAQDGPPRLAVSVAFGQARPLSHDANDFLLPTDRPAAAGTWSATVQTRASKHLIIEAVFSRWILVQAASFTDHSLSPDGALIVHDHVDVRLTNGTNALMFNAIATTALGRFRLSSGAGVGYATVSNGVSVQVSGCADPAECHSSEFLQGGLSAFGIQGVLGTDVRLTRRLQAFVVYRLTLPFTPGFGEVSVAGGLRVAIR
jgi:hypothetical protein